MRSSTGNVCIRCGKQRIEGKTWKESTKGGIVTHTTTICPDSACQKIVDQQFADQNEKREAIEKEREKEREKRAFAPKITRRRT